MKNKIKNFIAATAAVVMVFQPCAGTIAADSDTIDAEVQLCSVFDGGSGTETDPYLISTEEQLAIVADLPTYCFKMTNDITLTEEWTPMCGVIGDSFTGVFDGGGYTVYNMAPKNTSSNEVSGHKGLFAINNGTIKNVIVQANDNSEYSGWDSGVIAGYNDENGVISACGATGNISGYWYVGGLVGYNCGKIENCYAICNVTSYGYTGGLVGGAKDSSVIINSYAASSFGDDSDCYGLSYHHGTVTNSYYDKSVSGCTDTGYGEPKSTLGLKIESTFVDWDFENIWTIDESVNDGYPSFISSANASVQGVLLDKTSVSIETGETVQLTASVSPAGAANKNVTWISENDAIATVSSSGLVTGVAVGTTTVTVTTEDGEYSASCTVMVTQGKIAVTGITLDKSAVSILTGETYTLSPTVLPFDATNKSVSYSSSDNAVATVSSDGVITAVSAGNAIITVTSTDNSSVTAVCDVTVTNKKVAVTGITLNVSDTSTPLELEVGSSLTLTATVLPENATNSNVMWYSNYSDIATVENGVVTGVSVGTTTVTATTEDGGYSATCTVNVVKAAVAVKGISFKQSSVSVETKKSVQLNAVITPADADNQTITYSSANNAIASVSSTGLVTGISTGTTLIKAVSENDSGTYTAYCTVTVTKPTISVKSLKLNKSELKMVEGKSTTLNTTINPSNATNQTIIWESSDESVVSVDSNGTLTANAVGEATIAATTAGTTSNGETCTTYCAVTVYADDTPATISLNDQVVKAGKEVSVTVNLFANPGMSAFNLKLKYDNTVMYPVSYEKLDLLSNINVITALDSASFQDKDEVSFVCTTSNYKNFYTDGDLITVNFMTYDTAELGTYTVEVEPYDFANENYEYVSFAAENAEVEMTDYIIGDINDDDEVDLIDAMLLGQSLAGYDVTLSETGTKAAVRIYPDSATAPNMFDLQHLMRYLADWQVELGKM